MIEVYWRAAALARSESESYAASVNAFTNAEYEARSERTQFNALAIEGGPLRAGDTLVEWSVLPDPDQDFLPGSWRVIACDAPELQMDDPLFMGL